MEEQTMYPLTFEINSDGSRLVAKWQGAGSFEMDAARVEQMIFALIEDRARMQPRRLPVAPFGGEPMVSGPNMRWQVMTPPPGKPGIQLAMSHPGLGWIGMDLDDAGVDDLVSYAQQFRRRP